MLEMLSFKGSATELCGLLTEKYSQEFFPNMMKKELTLHGYELQSYGVKFSHKRSNGQRLIMLEYDRDSDTGDGKNLMPEPSQNADPAVTADESDSSQTIDTIDSASTGNSKTSKELADPVGQLAVPFRKTADPVARYVTASILHSQTTRPAGTGNDTGQRGASVSKWKSKEH